MTATAMALRGAAKGLDVITLGTLLDEQFAPREDLVFPWLRQEESAMIYAPPGVGKTMVALTLALMVAGGGRAMGWSSPKPRKVLLVDGEMNASDLQERILKLLDAVDGIDREAVKNNLCIMSRNWQKLTITFPDLGESVSSDGKKSGQKVVLEAALKHEAELVILDNFSTLVTVSDENDASSMRAMTSFLMTLKQAQMGTILIHHAGKTGNSYRGSSMLATTFEVIIGLIPKVGGSTLGGAQFETKWEKYRGKAHQSTRSSSMALAADDEGKLGWTVEESASGEAHQFMEALESGLYSTQKDIGEALGWDQVKTTRRKMDAIKAGLTTDHMVRTWLKGVGEIEPLENTF